MKHRIRWRSRCVLFRKKCNVTWIQIAGQISKDPLGYKARDEVVPPTKNPLILCSTKGQLLCTSKNGVERQDMTSWLFTVAGMWLHLVFTAGPEPLAIWVGRISSSQSLRKNKLWMVPWMQMQRDWIPAAPATFFRSLGTKYWKTEMAMRSLSLAKHN